MDCDVIRIPTSPRIGRIVSVAAIASLGALDWTVGGYFSRFYSLPVALSALADGWRGGLAAAVVSSIVLLSKPGNEDLVGRDSESLALVGLGLLVGVLLERIQKQKRHYQALTEQLSAVNEKVQANFEGMKRVERLSALGQLSAGLAHEIRNPLASIAGAAAILQRNKDLEPKHEKCIEIIAHECQRLDGLLTTFLNFARPRPPHFQAVDLDPVLRNVVELASHGLRGKTVHYKKEAEPGLPLVECDSEQLEQVLLNLMINAMEASPEGETVTLAAVAQGGKVAIRVIDQGSGVAPAHVDQLFDPFFTTKEHGTGLGLPVAHQIVTQMGGSLLAQRNPGRGMMFSVILPAKHGQS